MKRKLLFAAIMIASALGGNLYAQFDANKVYTIANNNDATKFIQDNGETNVAVGPLNDNSYWKFVSTGNANCYYIQNATTGKFIQGYSNSGDEIAIGNSGVEYYVKADASGNLSGKYRMSCTANIPHDFSSGTLGLNWKGASDASCGYDCIQAFASVAGGNPRSAWIVNERVTEEPQFDATKTYVISNRNDNDGTGYLQDNGNSDKVVAIGTLSENSYWQFVPTGQTNRYYVKNATTELYLQSCVESGTEILLGTTPVEYNVALCAAEGDGIYGMASTDQATYDFTSGTMGLNWKIKQDTGREFDTGQAFAAVAGTNHRSFWKIVEQEIPQPISTFDTNKKYTILNYAEAGYLKDDRSGILRVQADKTSNALWTLEPTGNEGCYYILNALTGKYVQACVDAFDATNEDGAIKTGTTPVEYKVANDPAKGANIFAFASTTDQDDFSFADNKPIAINWRGGSNYAQGYYANLGGNPRSFWKVEEVEVVEFSDIEDNTSAIAAAVGDGKNAIVKRTAANGMWNTLVVPHAMNAQAITRNFGDGAKVAELTGQSNGNLTFSTVDAIEAGKPYLVKPTIDVVAIITMNTTVASGLTTSGEGDYQFVGIYEPTVIGTDDYFMAANNTLVKNGAGGQMKAFRAYFRAAEGGSVKALVSFNIDDTETGIIVPEATIYEDTRIFNLAGQQVNQKNALRGIYIVGGKIIVK